MAERDVLKRSTSDALEMLSFASRQGIDLPQDAVSAIINVERAGDDINEDQEKQFWHASFIVAKAIKPVTIESIRSTAGAIVATRRYRERTIITLIFLLLFQIYWLVGATAVNNLTAIRGRLEGMSDEFHQTSREIAALDQNKPEFSEAKKKLDADNADILYKVWPDRMSASTNFDVLRNWNLGSYLLLLHSTPPLEPETTRPNQEQHFLWVFTAQNLEQLQVAQIILTALFKYFLPLLYGALGASAYIVRSLTTEIRDSTYTLNSDIRYQLRFYLGAVAGLSIAWFTSEPRPSTVLQSLSPLALAFLAGYSVELLFSLLDRIVTSFSGPAPEPKIIS